MQDPRFNRRQLLSSGLALAGLSALPAHAQTPAWPAAKPIRLIVNFPAGGSPDAVARAVAGPVSAAIGQQIVVDNRGGAGGIIGADAVAKSPADGYTFLLSSGSAAAIVPLLNNKMPYDAAKDLIPVAAGARLELFLVVRADAPYKTYAEFVAHAKRNPGRLSYGSPGNGTSPHIAGEMLKSQAGIFTVHIPYRGSAAVLQDLLAGSLDYTFDPGIAFSHVRSGRLRLLAVGSVKRTPMFPDAPTLIELGLPGFDAGTTHGFWAPAGTPPEIVDRMNREINRALGTQPVIDVIRSLGAEPQPITPRQFSEVIRADMARYAKIIQERKITQD
ncbi:MAG: tripartite tricarboxylate transporter substrate binding protein [Rubrivivax sp.]|jgi:tripartite-type tricarboxylate transporter receptor subunit TctC|nr:tripartite tricarboxylate transporter substrate binding protein [Rubrivivax sp.]